MSAHNLSHLLIDIPLWTVGISSALYKLFPPPDKFNDWPRFKGYYKLVYTFVSYVALNK